jgi:ATP-dependent Clp protease ATP-binding subunit ClpA
MFERFSKEARSTVTAAVSEAERFHSDHVGVEHLLLGLLGHSSPELAGILQEAGTTRELLERRLEETSGAQPFGADDAEALRSIGIDLDAVSRSLEAVFGPDPLKGTDAPKHRGLTYFGRTHFSPAAKKVLELSLREAIAHKDKTIDAAHLLLGILRSPDTAASLLGGDAGANRLRDQVQSLLRRTA